MVVISYIRYLRVDKEFKMNNIQVAREFNLDQALKKGYKGMKKNVALNKRYRANVEIA